MCAHWAVLTPSGNINFIECEEKPRYKASFEATWLRELHVQNTHCGELHDKGSPESPAAPVTARGRGSGGAPARGWSRARAAWGATPWPPWWSCRTRSSRRRSMSLIRWDHCGLSKSTIPQPKILLPSVWWVIRFYVNQASQFKLSGYKGSTWAWETPWI